MRQFQVPQFITIEDKVIGPFTVKQFLYILGGIGVIAAAYYFLKTFLVIPIAIIAGSFAASLAFLKVNEQPFPRVLKNALFYGLRPRVYIWKKAPILKAPAPLAGRGAGPAIQTIPKLSRSKLSDLAWSLDIQEKLRE